MIDVAVIGAAGLSGLELISRLSQHPQVRLKYLTSSKYAGQAVADVFPQFMGMPHEFSDHEVTVAECDVAFLAIPNPASLQQVPKFLPQGVRVIDLSGVYRLRDRAVFEKFYKLSHTSPHLLAEAVFGLPEYFRHSIPQARLVANPGCYPTGALLGLLPFGERLALLKHPPLIDAKSGVSGAGGRVEDESTNYVSVNENFSAYKIFQHQHLPEIQQYLEDLTPYQAEQHGTVIFTPHLLPLTRGILTTLYLQFREPVSMQEVRASFEQTAQQNPFFHLLPARRFPDLNMVRGSNRCMVGIAHDDSATQWIVITALDNLVKGAAGQAIQNMNLMFEFEETEGLL